MDILELVKEAGLEPKRKAATNGGEYSSACPFCKDGDDRFLTWPSRHNKTGEYQGGRFTCRVCGKYGDAISFLCQYHGLSYRDACAQLRIEPKKRNSSPLPRSVSKPNVVNEPPSAWSEKAVVFIDWCHAQLMKDPQSIALLTKRGFTLESIKRFKLGFNSGEKTGRYQKDFRRERDGWGLPTKSKEGEPLKPLWLPIGLTIPTFSQDERVIKVKVRRPAYEKEMETYEMAVSENEKPKWKPQKYIGISGSKECPSVYGDQKLSVALVLESELDALIVQQEVADLLYCVALGGSTKPLDAQTDQLLRKTQLILFLPDFDEAGAAAWVKWKKMFPTIQRILTPCEKSAGDYFQTGGNLREWLKDSIEKFKLNQEK
jgi:DNA primase